MTGAPTVMSMFDSAHTEGVLAELRETSALQGAASVGPSLSQSCRHSE